MFVKLHLDKPSERDIWVNTDLITYMYGKGKSFYVHMSGSDTFALNLTQYLVLAKALKIKQKKVKRSKPIIKPKVKVKVGDKRPKDSTIK